MKEHGIFKRWLINNDLNSEILSTTDVDQWWLIMNQDVA